MHIKVKYGDYMNWPAAIERYAINKSLQVKSKNPVNVIKKTTDDINYVLSRMPELASKNISDITPEMFHEMLNNHRKANNWHWDAIIDGNKGVYSGKYSDLVRCLVFARDNFTCKICGRSALEDPKLGLHLDHKVPKSQRGDTFSLDNLQCTCESCNLLKQTKSDVDAKNEINDMAESIRKKEE